MSTDNKAQKLEQKISDALVQEVYNLHQRTGTDLEALLALYPKKDRLEWKLSFASMFLQCMLDEVEEESNKRTALLHIGSIMNKLIERYGGSP